MERLSQGKTDGDSSLATGYLYTCSRQKSGDTEVTESSHKHKELPLPHIRG